MESQDGQRRIGIVLLLAVGVILTLGMAGVAVADLDSAPSDTSTTPVIDEDQLIGETSDIETQSIAHTENQTVVDTSNKPLTLGTTQFDGVKTDLVSNQSVHTDEDPVDFTADEPLVINGTEIGPSLQSELETEDETQMFIRLDPVDVDEIINEADSETDDLSNAEIAKAIQAETTAIQEPVLTDLEEIPGVNVLNTFWSMNAILVEFETANKERNIKHITNHDAVWRLHSDHEIRDDSTYDGEFTHIGSEERETADDPSIESGTPKSINSGEYTWPLEIINIPEIREEFDMAGAEKGDGVDVAVLDTGVDPDHPDLEVDGWEEFQGFSDPDSDPYECEVDVGFGHGTHVSGIIVGDGTTDSGEKYGVAPEANLHHAAMMTVEETGNGTLENPGECRPAVTRPIGDTVDAIEWAYEEQNADVISMSIGGTGILGGILNDPYVNDIAEVIDTIESGGAVPVAATGNDGEGNASTPGNTYDGLTVGSVDQDQNVWVTSGGKTIDTEEAWCGISGCGFAGEWPEEYTVPHVTAPGVFVPSAAPTDHWYHDSHYRIGTGTSMAAPHVSGAVAILLAMDVDNELGPDEIKDVLTETAVHPNSDQRDNRYGDGIIDPYAAIIELWIDAGIFDETVAPEQDYKQEDTVETSVTVENTGDRTHEFFVGHSVFDSAGTEYHNDNQTGTAVELAPGESEQVSVPWVVENNDGGVAPLGTYDSQITVWAESDPDNLMTPLETIETTNAFEVVQEDTDESTTLEASPNSWDLGSIAPGNSYDGSFTIENTGTFDTDISISGGSGISISGEPNELEAGESDSFSATLDADNYDGDSLTVTYDGGTFSIPISATLVGDGDLVEDDSQSVSDPHFCIWQADIWGEDRSINCDDQGYMDWVDEVEIEEEALDGFVGATLTVELGTTDGDDGPQENPADVYINGEYIESIESPDGGGEFKTETIDLSEEDLQAGENEVKITTTQFSAYQIGGGTQLEWEYFEPPELDITLGSHPDEVDAGSTFILPVTVENEGGQVAENVGLGISSLDSELEIEEWPDTFGVDDERDLEPLELDTGYYVVKLEEEATASGEIAALADNVGFDYPDDSFTVSAPNDPPTLDSQDISSTDVYPDEEVTYTAAVTDPDSDGIEVMLEVYIPSEDAWESIDTQEVSGSGTADFTTTPFSAEDIGEASQYRFQYETEFGHTGTWGPFSGLAISDPNPEGPSIDAWAYPSSVEPNQDIEVSVEITDPAGVSVADLEYTHADGTQDTIAMSHQSDSVWSATIPAPDDPTAGQNIVFTVTATDDHQYPSDSVSEQQGITIKNPVFDVEIDETNEPIPEGEILAVNTTVSNVGEISDTQTIQLEDLNGNTVDIAEINLDPGEEQTLQEPLVWDTDIGDTDEGDIMVRSDTSSVTERVSITTESEEPTDSAEPAFSSLMITGSGDDAVITEGDDEPIMVDVENVGNEEGTFTIDLHIDNVSESIEITLAGGETETVVFDRVTGDLNAQESTYTVSVQDNKGIADELTGNLTVEEAEESTDERDSEEPSERPEEVPEVPDDIDLGIPGFGVIIGMIGILATVLLTLRIQD